MRGSAAARLGTGLLLLTLVVAAAACSPSSEPVLPAAPPPSAHPGDVISWGEAAASIGQTITVEGPVTSVRKGQGPGGPALFVTVGVDPSDPQRFVAVIPYKVLRDFSTAKRERLPGGLVRVTGTIVKYDGAATIILRSPRQLHVQ